MLYKYVQFLFASHNLIKPEMGNWKYFYIQEL